MNYLPTLLFLLLLSACASSPEPKQQRNNPLPKQQRPISIENGKIFEKNGRRWLFGGDVETMHFDISNSMLEDSQYHYGIGREAFPALLKPAFTSVENADVIWEDSSRFLVALGKGEIKAYGVKDLIRHEVVNDQLDGEPIMAAYCILADLGAIYKRKYGDTELTFALSGYTYYDEKVWEGLDGFVLWDRETESLWWPLIGKAVSGKLKGVNLLEMDKSKWLDTNWKEVKDNYPQAKVMLSGLDFERPTEWERLENVSEIVTSFSD
ncbi:MAG: DUF3179 domain-containing (seleno)protein [Bacteroidota bacterium]